MSALSDLYRGRQSYDFPRLWRWTLVVSALLLAVSIGSLLTRGLNLGIEFEGGTSWEVRAPDATVGTTRDALAGTDAAAGKIQIVGGDTVRVRADLEDSGAVDAVDEVTETLAAFAGVDRGEVSVTTVGPSWGDEITEKARNALVWFFIIVAAYIAVRLEWKMAVGALAAAAHDILISVGVYSVFEYEVTPATVIAFLTITGYSLYDTVVVYDKVREVDHRLSLTGRYTYTEMMNLALNQVLMRSINTSITSVLPVLSMLVVGSFFLGALTLQEFAIALLVGLLVGAYSSIFIASVVVVGLKEREPRYREIADKLDRRGVSGEGTRRISEEDAALGAAATSAPASRPAPARARPSGVPPRPRKKKKR